MKKKTLLSVVTCALVLTACGTTEDTISDDQTTEVQSEVIMEDTATNATSTNTSYSDATALSNAEVESYALDVRDMILNSDWENFVNEINYPIIVDGLTMEDASDLTDYIADSKVSAEFLSAIEAETCTEMFSSEQGITMGAEGQIWLATVQGDDGGFVLKVVEINNMFEE